MNMAVEMVANTPLVKPAVKCTHCGITIDYTKEWKRNRHRVLCDTCVPLYKCVVCGRITTTRLAFVGAAGTETPCCNCHRSELTRCYDCGAYMLSSDPQTITESGSHVCQSCVETHHVNCVACDGLIRTSDCHVDRHSSDQYCYTCFHERFALCDSCDCQIDADDVLYYQDDPYCESCYEDVVNETARGTVHGYDYRPRPKMHAAPHEKEPLYFGLELETSIEGNYNKARDKVLANFSENESLFYLKSDCTIPGYGFELVTHPCTLKYHQKEFPWEKILELLIHHKGSSHNNSSCGLHIHISKKDMSITDKIKLGMFVHTQKERMFFMSRRTKR